MSTELYPKEGYKEHDIYWLSVVITAWNPGWKEGTQPTSKPDDSTLPQEIGLLTIKCTRYKLVTVHRTAMCCRQREPERGLVYAAEVNHRPFKHIWPNNHLVACYPDSNQFSRCRLGECVIIELNGLWWLVQNGPC